MKAFLAVLILIGLSIVEIYLIQWLSGLLLNPFGHDHFTFATCLGISVATDLLIAIKYGWLKAFSD